MYFFVPAPSPQLLQQVLQRAVAGGADFAEVFFETSILGSLTLNDKKIENANTGHICGVGLRVISGLHQVYLSGYDVSSTALFAMADKAAAACTGSAHVVVPPLVPTTAVNIHPVQIAPKDADPIMKASALHQADQAARTQSRLITQVSCGLHDITQQVRIANSNGLCIDDTRVRTRFTVGVTASDGTQNQSAFEGPGISGGYELITTLVSPQNVAEQAATSALTMLSAPPCPAGRFDVAIDSGFGGVLFHEACGHSLESEAVSRNSSEFAGKLGEKIAGDVVTAIDDGTIPGAWGSTNIDDEGHPTQKNVLIKDGVLTGYMCDMLGGRRMGMASTGNGRRQDYHFAPVSRMSNTYIAPGSSSFDEIISSMEHGLYCKKMGGGSVNPVTGEFNFSVSEGYLVQNGVITGPVRGASLIGTGSKTLLDIDMVSNNLALGQGVCGASSGHVPTNVGQPLIRIKNMVVGGSKI